MDKNNQDKKHGYKLVFQSYNFDSKPRDVNGEIYSTKEEALLVLEIESKKWGCDYEI